LEQKREEEKKEDEECKSEEGRRKRRREGKLANLARMQNLGGVRRKKVRKELKRGEMMYTMESRSKRI
jgi:hypothetical protein